MSQALNQQGILLESGTNEMELLEFYLQGQRFGVNVAKIRQLMPYHHGQVTLMVGAHEYVLGTLLWQGHSIPLIDLNLALGNDPTVNDELLPTEEFLFTVAPLIDSSSSPETKAGSSAADKFPNGITNRKIVARPLIEKEFRRIGREVDVMLRR